jgi:uncharacterized protein YndB with AHSA1/START domain
MSQPGAFALTQILDAPREVVWKAWTEPEQLARWWGPLGFTTNVEIREVIEPERLVFSSPAQRGLGPGIVTVTLRDLGERTELTCHYVARHPDDMWADVRTGWSQQLERLATHVHPQRTGGEQ